MPIYPMRAALLSPGRNWEVVRSSSTVLSQYYLGLPTLRRQSLGGPRMHYWRAQEWSWLGSARLRCPKKDRRRPRIVSDKNGCPVRDRTSSFETKSIQWIWRIRLRHQLSSASIFFDITQHKTVQSTYAMSQHGLTISPKFLMESKKHSAGKLAII